MAKDSGLAVTIDKESINKILNRIDENGLYMNEMVDEIVHKYSKPLDELLDAITDTLGDSQNPPTDTELDQMALKIPSKMYYVGEALERLGVMEDVSKAIKLDVYNRVHTETNGTVSDKETKAELASQQEFIVNSIYARAYKKLKNKMESASEVLGSVKKVISRRMTEAQLSGISSGRFQSFKNTEE